MLAHVKDLASKQQQDQGLSPQLSDSISPLQFFLYARTVEGETALNIAQRYQHNGVVAILTQSASSVPPPPPAQKQDDENNQTTGKREEEDEYDDDDLPPLIEGGVNDLSSSEGSELDERLTPSPSPSDLGEASPSVASKKKKKNKKKKKSKKVPVADSQSVATDFVEGGKEADTSPPADNQSKKPSAATVVVDEYADMPALVDSTPFGRSTCASPIANVWFWEPDELPQTFRLSYALVGPKNHLQLREVSDQKKKFVFPDKALWIETCARNETCWVARPPPLLSPTAQDHPTLDTAVMDVLRIWPCRKTGDLHQVVMYQGIPACEKFVTDMDQGVWGLCRENVVDSKSNTGSQAGTKRNADGQSLYVLLYIDASFPRGQVMASHVPCTSKLFLHAPGGVWLWVDEESRQGIFPWSPGLYFHDVVLTLPRLVLPMNTAADKWLVASDSSRQGIFILQSPPPVGKTPPKGSHLIHVKDSLDNSKPEEQILEVDFACVQLILDDGGDGILLHYKDGERWKVGNALTKAPFVEELCECPKTSRLMVDRDGGIWIMHKKKTGKAGSDRSLQYRSTPKKPYDYKVRRLHLGTEIFT